MKQKDSGDFSMSCKRAVVCWVFWFCPSLRTFLQGCDDHHMPVKETQLRLTACWHSDTAFTAWCYIILKQSASAHIWVLILKIIEKQNKKLIWSPVNLNGTVFMPDVINHPMLCTKGSFDWEETDFQNESVDSALCSQSLGELSFPPDKPSPLPATSRRLVMLQA